MAKFQISLAMMLCFQNCKKLVDPEIELVVLKTVDLLSRFQFDRQSVCLLLNLLDHFDCVKLFPHPSGTPLLLARACGIPAVIVWTVVLGSKNLSREFFCSEYRGYGIQNNWLKLRIN